MRIRNSIAIVATVLVLLAVWAGLSGVNPPILRAAQGAGKSPRARLWVLEHPPRVLFDTAERPQLNYVRYLKTQATLIKSDLVLTKALADPRVSRLPSVQGRTDAVAWIQESLEIINPNDTEVIEIAMAPGPGPSDADQAAIVNAVAKAYMDEVVNIELRRRTEWLDRLKRIKEKYSELLLQRREALRRSADSDGRGGRLTGREKEAWPPLYRDLQAQQIKLRMERAEVEVLLERRKKDGGPTTDAGRKEAAQLEDRLAVLAAGQKVIDEELERLTEDVRRAAARALDQRSEQVEIDQIEQAYQKVAAEVEALAVEIEAPPRVRLIDMATAGKR
jgi:hypothetical protein